MLLPDLGLFPIIVSGDIVVHSYCAAAVATNDKSKCDLCYKDFLGKMMS